MQQIAAKPGSLNAVWCLAVRCLAANRTQSMTYVEVQSNNLTCMCPACAMSSGKQRSDTTSRSMRTPTASASFSNATASIPVSEAGPGGRLPSHFQHFGGGGSFFV